MLAIPVMADSVWNENQSSLYGSTATRKVGDVVTIFISEAASAVHEAGTQTRSQSDLNTQFDDVWNQVALRVGEDQQLRKSQRYGLRGENNYTGMGQTSRKSSVKAVITAVITDILRNGNLYVVGEHKVKINEETETIRVSGVVKPEYITPKNTVYSYQIANVEVSVKGSGTVATKQSPSLMSKFFGWLF